MFGVNMTFISSREVKKKNKKQNKKKNVYFIRAKYSRQTFECSFYYIHHFR